MAHQIFRIFIRSNIYGGHLKKKMVHNKFLIKDVYFLPNMFRYIT